MPILVQTLTAVNGVLVPFERATSDLIDPRGLTSGGERDDVEFDRVALTGTGSHAWLCLAVGFTGNSQQWHRRAGSLPLFQEMRARILDQKRARGGPNSRIPRQPHAAIAIRVRDRTIILQNCTKRITLCMDPEPSTKIEPLQWLLTQILSDLEKAPQGDAASIDVAETQDTSAGDTQETQETIDDTQPQTSDFIEEAIADAVSELRDLDQCASACWAPSRHTFRIVSKISSGVLKEFRVQMWAKRHREASAGGNDEPLIAAIAEAKDQAARYVTSGIEQ